MQTFAERLISLREDKGWKKKELAEKLHVSDSMISQYESGRCMHLLKKYRTECIK